MVDDDVEDDDDLIVVVSGRDILQMHHRRGIDLDEVIERSRLDRWRGIVITQVAVVEDLVDEFILYLDDPEDVAVYRRALAQEMIGRRINNRLEALLRGADLLDGAQGVMAQLRQVVGRRNQLAHGTLHRNPPIGSRGAEWFLQDRREGTRQSISRSILRGDRQSAIDCFRAWLEYAERFVEVAPAPVNFLGGEFLAPPTP